MAVKKYAYGISSLIISDIDPVTGLAVAGGVEVKDEVFRDTFNLTTGDGNRTDQFAEMSVNPDVSFLEQGTTTGLFSLMNTSAARKQLLMGGTVTTVDLKETWSQPNNKIAIEKNIVATTVDGTVITIYRASVDGKLNFQFRRNNILLLDANFAILQPKVDGLPAMDVSDPAA
jgi:hypothetical protein